MQILEGGTFLTGGAESWRGFTCQAVLVAVLTNGSEWVFVLVVRTVAVAGVGVVIEDDLVGDE